MYLLNVMAGMYLEKEKEGKKKMKTIGSVELPSDAFLSILKVDDE